MNRIKAIRTGLGVTQDAFAAAAGVGQSTVSRWESNDADPTIKEVLNICAAYPDKVTPAHFFDEEKTPERIAS